MSLALEMFAVAPVGGNANLSEAQSNLLAGKARWIRAAWEAGLTTAPTILISRAAWDALQAERRQSENRLRAHWVATLFRLVSRDGRPPALAVRTATDLAISGLTPARIGLPAPASEAEAVIRRNQANLGILLRSEDTREGLAAFAEKRAPVWKNR